MLKRVPTRLPSIEEMLLQLGRPSADTIARALHVSPRTVQRWLQSGHMPRAAQLAIYWLTHAGRAEIELDMHNELMQLHGLVRAYRDEVAKLREQLARLVSLGDFGAANEPVMRA